MSILQASAQGATFLILLQVASRGFTFAVNQILLRYLSPELLGLSTQLELYSITVLYFARESIRVAAQRESHHTQPVVNLSYLSVVFGTPLAYVLALLYLHSDLPAVPYFIEALTLYGISCVVELLSEPAFVTTQQKLLYRIRASSEAAATICRCLVTCGSAIWASRNGLDLGALPFALGQFSYSMVLTTFYILQLLGRSSAEKFSLLPRLIESKDGYVLGLFPRPLVKLSFGLLIQNSFKFVLTQGDGLLIAAIASLRDQGSYALASNYGGLVARMLFQPIEESSRNMFAKVCSPSDESEKRKSSSSSGLQAAQSLLRNILKLYGILALVACATGPTLAPILLGIVAGSRWAETEASSVLATYCYYIPLLAVNGVTEAFVAAVATNEELYTQSLFMALFFTVFSASTFLFLKTLQLGASGLVYSNCVNMALRIMFNFNFIMRYFKRNGEELELQSIFPNPLSIASAVAVVAALNSSLGSSLISSRGPVGYGQIWDLLPPFALSGGFYLLLLLFEREFLLGWVKPLLSTAKQAETELPDGKPKVESSKSKRK